jgi:hypothetical protein
LNKLGWWFICVQAVTAIAAGVLMIRLHLSITGWSSEVQAATHVTILASIWLYLFLVPGRQGSGECRVAETLFLLVLMICFTVVGLVAQYPAIAIGLPYADPWLARADAFLGLNVASLANWTGGHPAVARVLTTTYASYGPQCLLTILGLSILRDRAHLWEFVFHFHTFLLAVVVGVALCPAVCPPAFFGFVPVIDMTRLIAQIRGFHDGSLTTIRIDQFEGLVSFPSFHAAGALMVAWAWRAHPWIGIPVLLLNLCVVASTFLTGVHYVVDVLVVAPLFIASVMVYRRYGQPLLRDEAAGAGATI